MAKNIISASIEEKTELKVRELAKLEKRSFSQMIDLLLLKALETVRKKQTGSLAHNDSGLCVVALSRNLIKKRKWEV